MSDHEWRKGLAFSLTTAFLWGVLPIALTIALEAMDAYTVTWYRFVIASACLVCALAATRSLPRFAAIDGNTWRLLALATVGLSSNYVLFLLGLDHTSPTLTQVLSQLGPLFLLIGGVTLFHERLSRGQAAGVTTLVIGLIVFFNHRLAELASPSSTLTIGVALLVLGSAVWPVYGLAQKKMLERLGAQQILAFVYVGSIILLLPLASPSEVTALGAGQLGALLFCGLNTFVAYGAFAESLKHWQVSRTGAVLATTPLFTLASMWLVEKLLPGLVGPESLDASSIAGALLVVGGSATCALGAVNRPLVSPPSMPDSQRAGFP